MLDDLLSLLYEHQRFFITTHVRPDGDAIGSQLALGAFLQHLGKEVAMINSDPPPRNLEWLPGIEAVEVFENTPGQLARIAGADVVLVVDTNALERLGNVGAPVENSGAVKVLIDHHTGPEAWFDLTYARDTASSTGELVYEVIAAHDPDIIDPDVAHLLYAAILTDTGSFRYSSVTPAVHRIAADLLERGDLQPDVIYTLLYETRTLEGLRLMARVLSTLTLAYDGILGYVVVEQRMLEETGASSEETEGFVSYPLTIEGVRVALIFTETAKGTKVSFRSKGDMYVNGWAQAFGGGGHRNASGAFIRKPLGTVIDEIIASAPRFLDVPDAETSDNGMLSAEDAAYLATMMQTRRGR